MTNCKDIKKVCKAIKNNHFQNKQYIQSLTSGGMLKNRMYDDSMMAYI